METRKWKKAGSFSSEGCHSAVVPNVESLKVAKLEQVPVALNKSFEWLYSVPGCVENTLQEGGMSSS